MEGDGRFATHLWNERLGVGWDRNSCSFQMTMFLDDWRHLLLQLAVHYHWWSLRCNISCHTNFILAFNLQAVQSISQSLASELTRLRPQPIPRHVIIMPATILCHLLDLCVLTADHLSRDISTVVFGRLHGEACYLLRQGLRLAQVRVVFVASWGVTLASARW